MNEMYADEHPYTNSNMAWLEDISDELRGYMKKKSIN